MKRAGHAGVDRMLGLGLQRLKMVEFKWSKKADAVVTPLGKCRHPQDVKAPVPLRRLTLLWASLQIFHQMAGN